MSYDALIIGGGSNALTAACYLAKSGRKVAIVCGENEKAGLCAKHEFYKGFQSPGILNDTSMVRDWVIDDLQLEQHGLRVSEKREVLVLGKNQHFTLSSNKAETIQSLKEISELDATAYGKMNTYIDKVKGPISAFVNNIPADIVDPKTSDLWSLFKRGFQLRKLGKKDMLEILRLAPMAIHDYLDEWFENDSLKAALALPAVTESYSAPWAAGTNANFLIHQTTRGPGIEGEGLALTKALLNAAESLGVSFETSSIHNRIIPGKGVELKNGKLLESKTILSARSVKSTFLEMMDCNSLSHTFEQQIRNFRTRGLTSQLLLALDCPPALPGNDNTNNYILADELDHIERAFDPIKYNELPDNPVLEVYNPTLNHSELAPSGKTVLSVLVHYTPYDLEGGWSSEIKEKFSNRIIDLLDQKISGIKKSVLGTVLLNPQDIETRYGLSGGQLYEGEHALDQLLVRPSPECCQYDTPFDGLYLCSGSTFPGGGLTCAPGALAAKKVNANL